MIKIPTFIKWAGGKRKLLNDIESLLPLEIQRYFEPFLGGGSVFFFIRQLYNPAYIEISDKNPELINTFLIVRNNIEQLIRKLKLHKKNHSKAYYYKIRSLDPQKLSNIERAARFIYLNKTCFNGLYRVNSKGEFNVPIGRYKNPEIFNKDTTFKASKLLKGVKIKLQPFENVLDATKKGDFIYFDPCYNPKIRTSIFNSYTEDGFLEGEQRKLATLFRKLDKKGCKLMLSNSDTALVKKLYKGYKMKRVKCARSINSKADGRGKLTELIIINYSLQKITL